MTSSRTTLDREQLLSYVGDLEAERDRLRATIVGLSSLVALAHAAGFVGAAPPPPAAGNGHKVYEQERRIQAGVDEPSAVNGGRPFTRSP